VVHQKNVPRMPKKLAIILLYFLHQFETTTIIMTNLKLSSLELTVGKYSEIHFQILYKTLQINNTTAENYTI